MTDGSHSIAAASGDEVPKRARVVDRERQCLDEVTVRSADARVHDGRVPPS